MHPKIRSIVPRTLAVVLVAASAALAGATWAESDFSQGSGSGKKMELFLTSTGADANATAEVDFRPKVGHELLKIELRGLPAGTYNVLVGGTIIGTITVSSGHNGRGETVGRLRLEARNGHPLGFDPLGQPMRISQGGTVYFDDTLPSTGDTLANTEFSIDLVNAGVLPNASGNTTLRVRRGRMDFSVEIEDVPVGDYVVRVGGENQGSLTAAIRPGRSQVRGEAEFSNDPDEVGHLLLTFDPRDQLIEVLQGSTVIFSVTLPSFPPTH